MKPASKSFFERSNNNGNGARSGRLITGPSSNGSVAPSTGRLIEAAAAHQPPRTPAAAQRLTVWGLSARQLHDAFWSGFGVQCIRQGEGRFERRGGIERAADLYLLLEPDQCVVFDLSSIIERLIWHGAAVTRIKLVDPSPVSYDERIVCDERGLVQRIERCYGAPPNGARRVFITDRASLAERWAQADSPREGWMSIRRPRGGLGLRSPGIHTDRIKIPGRSFKLRRRRDDEALLEAIIPCWERPDRVVEGVEELAPGVWKLQRDEAGDGAGLIGPVWLGCGRAPSRKPGRRQCIVGPAWLADKEESLSAATKVEGRPPVQVRTMLDIELADTRHRTRPRRPESFYPLAKRALDVCASAAVLVLISPLMLLIALAIMIDNGRPVFFRHRRQTRGGREFDCMKFRTMLRNAEKVVPNLKTMNVCDGPQVYIVDDPRVTRVGRLLRRFHLDELPQFWNVLVGEMSLVGPRPSPDKENQYCPAWRELRLSVRPGITGLWQLKRTRSPGQDFQEWIRYDIEYVRKASFWLDVCILVSTARAVLLGRDEEKESNQ